MKRYSISKDDQVIEYELAYRPNVTRRIHLELTEGGTLQVIAPRRWSKRAIQSTLQQRVHHVVRFLADARSRQQDLPGFSYISGERHPFMGQWYPLDIQDTAGRRTSVGLVGERIQIVASVGDSQSIRARLTTWYRRQAEQQFSVRVAAFGQAASWTGGEQPTMRLRLMKRTWGSCSSKGVITLNPHLVKAPPECIDYVVAHEICHLEEHNHSKAFYTLQEQLYPGWREAKAHLRSRGHMYLHV